jgi:hypothetical protein
VGVDVDVVEHSQAPARGARARGPLAGRGVFGPGDPQRTNDDDPWRNCVGIRSRVCAAFRESWRLGTMP